MLSRRHLQPFPRLRAIAGILVLAALFGCMDEEVAGGTGVGNPPQGTATFAMAASSGDPLAKGTSSREAARRFTLTDAGGTRFDLERAVAHVTWVRLRTPAGRPCRKELHSTCEAEDIRLEGPFVADLMNGTLSPDLPAFQAPAGTYRRIEARLDDLDEDKAALEPALAGHSVVLSGTFAYAGRADRAFSLSLDFNELVRFEGGSMAVRQDTLTHLLLRFGVESWLKEIDIGRCLDEGRLVLDNQGNLKLDDGSNCDGLEKALKEAVKASGRMSERNP